MSYKCVVCGRGSTSGFAISHAHKGSKRRFKPNLQRMRIKLQGKTSREYVCVRCISAGKVQKAA